MNDFLQENASRHQNSQPPADWVNALAPHIAQNVLVESQYRHGRRGTWMLLESERPATIEGQGDREEAQRITAMLWEACLAHRAADTESKRIDYRLVLVPGEGESEPVETEPIELKVGEGGVFVAESEEATPGGMMNMLMRMNIQLHNSMMRQQSGVATILEKLGSAGSAQLDAVQKAIEFQQSGALMALEAEREQYDIKRDELEMQTYTQMAREIVPMLIQAKNMNSKGPTMSPPTTPQDAARGLHNSLNLSQVSAASEVLGRDEVQDMLAALLTLSTEQDTAAASEIARAILLPLAPHMDALKPLFAPPHIPPNTGAFQLSCLGVLRSSAGL